MNKFEEKKSIKGYKNLKKYLSHFKKYKWLCLGFWMSLVLMGVISFFSPLALGDVISNITVTQDFPLAMKRAFIFAGLELSSIIMACIRVPFFKKLENYVKRDVKLHIMQDSFSINIGEYEKLGNGVFITRLTNDLNSLAESFKSISETIVNFASKIGFIIFVFVINIYLGLFLLTFIIIRYLVYQIRLHYFAKMKPKVLEKYEYINAVIGESVRGIKDIKTLGIKNSILNKTEALQNDYNRADNNEWYVGIALANTAGIVRVICNLLFIALCIYLIGKDSLDLTIFYSVYVYKNNVMEFAVQLGTLQDKFKEMEVNAHRVFQLTDPTVYLHDRYGQLELPSFNGRIEFKNVSFEYEKDIRILDDISFVIEPNSHVAFVGESGCGKSTIVSLICRLYEATSGIVLFDETNSTLLTESFNSNVAMVNQSPYLFATSIRENMQLVKQDATDEEIYEALKLANAYDFVSHLPEGLDSNLGEGGTRLSGGQKQRICIARALLKKTRVLIFDESTSALDNISQERVMESVDKLRKNTTIITIAHRLSTIENCDKIYFIDKGKIIDSGTHKELLQNNKKYSTLYNKQKKEKQNIEDSDVDIVES